MRLTTMLGAALLATTGIASAGDFDYVDIYYLDAELDLKSTFGNGTADGDGFGVKGSAHVADTVTLHGEYQKASFDDSNSDLRQLRFGVGVHSQDNGSAARFFGQIEYLDVELDGSGENGLGVHGGVSVSGDGPVSGFARIGYVEIDDTDGLEFNIGLAIELSEGVSLSADYRTTNQELDSQNELDLNDIRLGIRLHFGT